MEQAVKSIERLAGQANYGTWAFAMEMVLTELDLWECVDDGFLADSAEAKRKDAKARSKICLMCKENIYPMIMHLKTARDTWQALQKSYADGGLLRRLYLLRKLFNAKLTMFSSMENYLNDILSTSQSLRGIKAGLDDEFVGIIMLAGLTDAYNPLVMTLEHSSIKISTESVQAALLKESLRKSSSTDTAEDDTATALMSKTKKGVICHLCKKKGHFKWQCQSRRTGDKSEDNKGYFNKKKDSKETSGLMAALSMTVGEGHWVVDSGATSHMTSDVHILENKQSSSSKLVTTANNNKIVSNEQGDVYVMGRSVRFEDVLMLPGLTTNLLSVSKMCAKGCTVVFNETCCKVYQNNYKVKVIGKPVFTAPLKQGLYVLGKDAAMVLTCPPEETSCASFDLWHRRLGHLSGALMVRLKSLVDGLTFKEVSTEPCEGCCIGKECVKKFPKGKSKRANDFLQLVHSDLAGPMEVESWGGNRYYLIFVDDFSRKTFGYLLKSKTEVLAKFMEFKALVENQTGKKIKKFRSDNGTEYTNGEFQRFLKKHGIHHQRSVPYTPQQNGVAERTIRTITEKARCMVHEAGLDKRFWGEAVGCAVYLKNRSPTMALKDKVPEEVFTGERVDLSNLKIFGCRAQVLVKDHSRKKFDPKTIQMIMTGYSTNSKAYRFINLKDDPRRIVIARDATFMENVPLIIKEKQEHAVPVSKNDAVVIDLQYDIPGVSRSTTEQEVPRIAGPVAVGVPVASSNEEESRSASSTVRASSLTRSDSAENFYDSIDVENPTVEDLQGTSVDLERPVAEDLQSSRRYPARNRVAKREKDMVYNFHMSEDPDPISVKDAMERSDKKFRVRKKERRIQFLDGE